MAFSVILDQRALRDIVGAMTYYNAKSPKLGSRFYSVLDKKFKVLSINPHFRIRYENVRCLPIKDFPFMIHYSIEAVSNKVTI